MATKKSASSLRLAIYVLIDFISYQFRYFVLWFSQRKSSLSSQRLTSQVVFVCQFNFFIKSRPWNHDLSEVWIVPWGSAVALWTNHLYCTLSLTLNQDRPTSLRDFIAWCNLCRSLKSLFIQQRNEHHFRSYCLYTLCPISVTSSTGLLQPAMKHIVWDIAFL